MTEPLTLCIGKGPWEESSQLCTTLGAGEVEGVVFEVLRQTVDGRRRKGERKREEKERRRVAVGGSWLVAEGSQEIGAWGASKQCVKERR